MDREISPPQAGSVDTDAAAQQRSMIATLASTLDACAVRYWLMGGWAVDTHLGRTTRAHSDIDLAVFAADRTALVEALGRHGLVAVRGAEPAGELFEGGPCPVEITYLVEPATGEIVTPGFEHWPYGPDAFTGRPVVVDGVEVPVMSVAALVDTKLHWQDHIGEPMRPHDRADLEALGTLLDDRSADRPPADRRRLRGVAPAPEAQPGWLPYVGDVEAPSGPATSRCPTCGFERTEWTRGDVTRTLAHAEVLVAEWSRGASRVDGDAVAAWGDAVIADVAAAGEPADRVHALWHGLVSIAERRRLGGDPAPTQRGAVTQLNRSGGGVPKGAVPTVEVGWRGVVGDVQATRVHHGRPWQALCLWSADVIGALVAEGHPIHGGAAGENVTIGGVDWSLLRGGAIVEIGAVRCQLSAPTTPCRKIRRWFHDGAVGRIDHDRHPGWSRWYASVLRPGPIATGDPVTIEPSSTA